MATEQTPVSSVASSSEGIDIVKALGILSLRSGDDHEHTHDHGDCHNHVPEGGKTMGQSIDMAKSEEDAKAIVESMENQRREIANARRKRGAEIQATLESLTIRELLTEILAAQSARVAAYREYDEGLKTILTTANLTSYPAICAKATASFSILSDSMNTIQKVLEEKHERKDLTKIIAALQKCEQEKLNVTAALHLEKIREQNELMQAAGDERSANLLKESVFTLGRRVATSIGDINELLEEIRYAMAEEDD